MIRLLVRFLKTVVGTTCITTTYVLARSIMKELMAPVPPPLSYSDVTMTILVGG